MRPFQIFGRSWASLFGTIAFALSQALVSFSAVGQQTLQQNVVAGINCSNSNNGTGHVLCLDELSNQDGATPLVGGFSWQAPNSPAPPGGGPAPIEPAGTVQTMTSISMPDGLLTGTAGCATTNDGTGTNICAIQGSDNVLYGIAIHPQPLGNQTLAATTSPLVPLLTPGQVLTNFYKFGPPSNAPCTGLHPCNRVSGIGGRPSCAATEGNMVICGVLVILQSSVGTAIDDLVGVAFDPRLPVSSTNPAILGLGNGSNFYSNPSCTSNVDPAGVVNGGKVFAACGIVYADNFAFSKSSELFSPSFDPRSGFDSASSVVINAFFPGDPSCATPRDNKGTIICAIPSGNGAPGANIGMMGIAFNSISGTSTMMNLGAPPAGDGTWSSFGCSSPVPPFNLVTGTFPLGNSVACVGTTSTNQILAVNFDPRTGQDPFTGNTPVFQAVPFVEPNGPNATLASAPSCVPENIINFQITCVIVDSFNSALGFAVPIKH